jgi:hypothetical protein
MADLIVTADPFKAQFWNLMQVRSWVILGARSVVRDAGLPANERKGYFEEHTMPDGRRELVEVHQPFTVVTLWVEKAFRGSFFYPTVPMAENAIIEALQAGRLTAYVLQNRKGDLKEIPAPSWADLKFWDEPDFAGPRDLFRYGATHLHSLRFRREEVLAIWPDPFDQPDAGMPGEPVRAVDNVFKGMDGLTWGEINMTFTERDAVRIRARGRSETFTYDAMGFKNQQSRLAKPNKSWETLLTLAIVTNTGKTLADTVQPQTDFKRRVSRVRRALRDVFGINGDPLPYGADGYKPAFSLSAEEHVIRHVRDRVKPHDEDEEDIEELMCRPPGR